MNELRASLNPVVANQIVDPRRLLNEYQLRYTDLEAVDLEGMLVLDVAGALYTVPPEVLLNLIEDGKNWEKMLKGGSKGYLPEPTITLDQCQLLEKPND